MADKVAFTWMIKLWHGQVEEGKRIRREEEAERERERLIEERKRQMREEIERRVGEVMKQIGDLQTQIEKQAETIDVLKQKIWDLEAQLDRERKEAAERERKLRSQGGSLEKDLAEALGKIVVLEEQVKVLTADLEESREIYRKAQAEHEAEAKRLSEIIKNITSELQQALVLTKYMREAMLKAKRDAAGSVSPMKFAELIAQLEEMRDQLGVLQKDYMYEKTSNQDLASKLDKNKRRLELERQFLPLIRGARGPLGPKNVGAVNGDAAPKKGDWGNVTAPSEAEMTEIPKKMARSQSLTSRSGPKGQALGG